MEKSSTGKANYVAYSFNSTERAELHLDVYKVLALCCRICSKESYELQERINTLKDENSVHNSFISDNSIESDELESFKGLYSDIQAIIEKYSLRSY